MFETGLQEIGQCVRTGRDRTRRRVIGALFVLNVWF